MIIRRCHNPETPKTAADDDFLIAAVSVEAPFRNLLRFAYRHKLWELFYLSLLLFPEAAMRNIGITQPLKGEVNKKMAELPGFAFGFRLRYAPPRQAAAVCERTQQQSQAELKHSQF
jgi:hypothetical protein